MASIASVCVYCGSSLGANPRHVEAARQLGAALAQHGIRLVYGGGRIGLMGQIADAVLAGGGQVVGVIPEHLQVQEKGHHGVTELRVVASMHERKNLMFQLSDAFVILPGGFGTLDEAFEMLTWRQLRLHDKPIILVDIDDYWQPFLKLVDHVIAEDFARPGSLALFTVVSAIDEIIPALRREPTPAIPSALG